MDRGPRAGFSQRSGSAHNESRCSSHARYGGTGEQSMTIQEAIQKAIEGGYHRNGADGRDTDDAGANHACPAWTRDDTDSPWSAGVQALWLDPHFWRSLGLAL